jgi:chemosensory pili system protein ChpA (sensor histidine kinase/response regulator)
MGEENSHSWHEQEIILEDEEVEDSLEQWLTDNSQESDDDDAFFEDLFAEEQEHDDENSAAEIDLEQDSVSSQQSDFWQTEASGESLNLNEQELRAKEKSSADEEWNELFQVLNADQQQEPTKEEEEEQALSKLDDLYPDEESSTEDFSWSQQILEPLEDLESIFANEKEKTFIQDVADSAAFQTAYDEHKTFSSTYIQESLGQQLSSVLDYYEGIDSLDSLINAPAQLPDKEDFDRVALEAYIEQVPEPVTPEESLTEITPPTPAAPQPPVASPAAQGGASLFEQTLKVPVRLMDNLNNLIGELVINRNSLEQDQERLRQFLDNLLERVQDLNDLGVQIQDLYERSLLENSLRLSKSHSNGQIGTVGKSREKSSDSKATYDEDYDPLEMDRFSGFHSLSQQIIELIVRVRESSSDIEFLVDKVEQEARIFRQVTGQLQEGFTEARMVPFSQVADRLPRAVRDISLKLNKKAQLQVQGKETLVDKMILEQLYDPLTHLVNNAITHGIESPEERQHFRKAETGTIKVEARHQGNQTIIAISDDGAGLDPLRIRRKAVEKGLISKADASALPDIDIFDFIFSPGFSTKEQADDFAGRGVGMDVVRSSLSKLRGSINIDSSPGKGTTFTIGLPLTLSITTALCCKLNQSNLAFPMDGVEDQFETTKDNIKVNKDGERFIRWQKSSTLLPFKPLSELLSYNRT